MRLVFSTAKWNLTSYCYRFLCYKVTYYYYYYYVSLRGETDTV